MLHYKVDLYASVSLLFHPVVMSRNYTLPWYILYSHYWQMDIKDNEELPTLDSECLNATAGFYYLANS